MAIQRRQATNPLLIPMIVFGGVMGLLAGYGALRMMGDNGIGMFATPAVAEDEPETTPDWARPSEPRTQPEPRTRPEPRV